MIQPLFVRRRLELFFAAHTLLFGLWLLRPVASMDGPGLTAAVAMLPEDKWGSLLFFNGLCHALALLVNGHRWWSPLIRWFAAMTTMMVYAWLSACIYIANPESTGVANYALLSIGAGLCLWSAWQDARIAVRIKYVTGQPNHA